ncbi:DUF3696 domain-containing protein [Lysobacter sp. SG-8]|uniref:DUF3696 domain-containing protein n=1 Tax=Marilutibacter penaei TaxID=2759900 RepID=A0A7W3U4N7_9GAMM|nr:DUF3696 domain-containing protein [Lysobacter penaei]MBB1088901.1 DUF3696 domain-containing protein [Lysobacter penaei]
MLSSVRVLAFKRFTDRTFRLAPLTILAGLNGAGKSSFVQSLLLAAEAESSAVAGTIRLNDRSFELGAAKDVQNWKSEDTIRIELDSTEGLSTWVIQSPAEDSLYLNVISKPTAVPFPFQRVSRALTYLCAERLGPRAHLPADPVPFSELQVGVRGEYCAQIIATIGSQPLQHSDRVRPTSGESSVGLLKYEIEGWLSAIARPVEIDAGWFPDSGVTALKFRSPGGDWVRATNMGFGVSYALPVVLAGLIAERGGLLIVENPEAHLHPAGQSQMGRFLAWIASCGVQVVLETHSDHLLNGIRLAIGAEKLLPYCDAVAHYFADGDGDEVAVDELTFTSVGGISHWPKGFFDQYQLDVATLGRIRRQR